MPVAFRLHVTCSLIINSLLSFYSVLVRVSKHFFEWHISFSSFLFREEVW